MYVYQTPLKCSQCGSSSSESFFRAMSSGIRCLSCGHEKVTQTMTRTEDKTETYYKMQAKVETF